MKNIGVLIKHLDALIEKATNVDEDGLEYFDSDLIIPACDLNDLYNLVSKAKKELSDKRESRIWELFRDMVARYPQESTEDIFSEAKRDYGIFESLNKE